MSTTMAVPQQSNAGVATWRERNQRWLSQHFEFWSAQLALREGGQPAAAAAPEIPAEDDFQPAALRLRELFGLTPFETDVLVLAAGIEVDVALRTAVARAQNAPTQDAIALRFSLALGLLPQPHWDAISPSGPLRHWSLVECNANAGFAQASMRIDERVLHYITGVDAFDERLTGTARFDDSTWDAEIEALATRIAGAMNTVATPLVLLANAKVDSSFRRLGRSLACATFKQTGLRTLWVDPSTLSADARDLTEAARRIDREAALAQAGIAMAIEAEGVPAVACLRLLDALRSPVVALGVLNPMQLAELPARQALRFTVPSSGPTPQDGLSPVVQRAAGRALQQFRVEPTLLEQALTSVSRLEDEAVEPALWDALRESARGGLDSLAQRIQSRTTYDDIIVPPFVAAQLREIAGQLRNRQQVYGEWGLGERNGRGLGIAALFAGESGTGKTLAAEAIANDAKLDLYRIDLASVISKYIGETEKNLSRLFDAAERSGAVLLFDEADALFGKRSEVKDSHDRYANIEVAYLLQRIESYCGLAILTTNMKSALDRAFLRRIRFVVQFPFPDEKARAQIWKRQFPPQVPLENVEFDSLAKLALSGGDIRSVAVNAAFVAADRGGAVNQQALTYAVQTELAKRERGTSGVRTEGLA